MRIVFDEAKRRANIEKHGYDFASLTIDFFDSAWIEPARQGRFIAIGPLLGVKLAVVFRPLGTEAVSLVSMRRASRSERTRHDR